MARQTARQTAGRKTQGDLSRLKWVPDLRAVSVAEGVRAALASAVLVLAQEWWGWAPLLEAALAAQLACLCDAGGPIRRRVPSILVFALVGGAFTTGYALLRQLPFGFVVPVACFGLFCTAFARAWGNSPMQVGNLLAVVQVLALDRPLKLEDAATEGLAFAGGALWALLLTAVIWRIGPFQPARRALADAYRRLALLCGDMRALLQQGDIPPALWEAHARAQRGATRIAIEAARTTMMETIQARGAVVGQRAEQSLIRLESLDQIFGRLIALSDLLEIDPDPALHEAADALLRLLRPMLVVLGDAVLHDRRVQADRLARATETIAQAVSRVPALRDLGDALIERLRIAVTLEAPEGFATLEHRVAVPWRDRLLAPLRANLNWRSVMLRHALRAAAMSAPALLIAHIYAYGHNATYGHWLPITVLMVLQPYYATTWQRALERTGGTVLGGLVAAALGVVATTPLRTAAVMFPLAILAFAVRPTSYGMFMVGLTPLVVLLSELGHGGAGWQIAGFRALFVVLGGILAVIGGVVLWPSWEPDRLRRQLRAALMAHAAFADIALTGSGDAAPPHALERARRAAGLASNEFETSLARALQEPRRQARHAFESLLTADATLRRLAGRLSAFHLGAAMDPDTLAAWRGWIVASLQALADDRDMPPRPERGGDAVPDAIGRIARQLELMEGALRRPGPDAETNGLPQTQGATI